MKLHCLGFIAALVLCARLVEPQGLAPGNVWGCPALVQGSYSALVCAASSQFFRWFEGTFLFHPQADGSGGGDGGGSGDGGGDGGGSGDGGASGDGSGTGEGDSGNGDGTGDAAAAVGAQGDQGDPGNSDDAAPSENTEEAPADPIDVTNSVFALPNNDPSESLRGPGSPGNGGSVNSAVVGSLGAASPGPTGSAGGLAPGVIVDVGINAVIVSGAPTPWEAIGKAPGVGNVVITGGIIALGETPLTRPPSLVSVGSAGACPVWLKFRPDLRLLNGSVFPPVVPNVIDIRTISNTEAVIENPYN
jgi:hypothetical protein